MSRRWVALAAVLVSAGSACSSHGATGTIGTEGTSTAVRSGPSTLLEEPIATDIGVTENEIRIAVVADVNNPFAPGLFQGSVDGVKGFADMINRQGGLAGRQVKVDFFDSKRDPAVTRNVLIQACQTDFAIVGTTSLFENSVDDTAHCKDAAGAPTGIPEIPELSTEPALQQSPVSFPILPPSRDWSNPTDEVYREQVGPYRWYLTHVGPDVHGVYVLPTAVRSATIATLGEVKASEAIGVKTDATFGFLGIEPQSGYDPVLQAIRQHGSTLARSGLDVVSTVRLRKEAAVQGSSTIKVWDCTITCYDPSLISLGGKDVEGQYVWSSLIPFEEADTNVGIREYLNAVGPGKANAFGAEAFMAGLFFRDVVTAMVRSDGINALTRASFVTAARAVHAFAADGMIGPTDVGAKVPGPCFVLMQVRNGQFARVYPTERGKLDCAPSNIQAVRAHITA